MRHGRTGRVPAFALAGLLVALAGCSDEEPVQRQPETTTEGIQATGVLGGGRVAVSTGDPEVVYGDCDPGSGLDTDLCVVGRTIDGVTFNLVLENPSVLVAGTTIPVRDETCDPACDDVATHALVQLRVRGETLPASGGWLRVLQAGLRYAVEFDLRFESTDRFTGSFDVRHPLAPPQGP